MFVAFSHSESGRVKWQKILCISKAYYKISVRMYFINNDVTSGMT